MSELNLSSSDMAIQNRKFAKTCVEKKRRDRINRCLDELKDLMSQAEDKARYQKMEKAEILEMAVAYMRNLRSSNSSDPSGRNGENGLHYYSIAFRQCLNDFQNFLCACPNVQDEFKSQIMGFMTQRYMEVIAPATAAAAAKMRTEQQEKEIENHVEQETPAAGCSGLSSKGTHGHVSKKHKLLASRYAPYGSRLSPHKKLQRISNQNDENEQQLNLMTIRSNGTSTNDSSSSVASPTQSSYFYQQTNKFGGSCSSLDSFMGGINAQPVSPALSTTSSSSECHNDSNRSQLLVASNSSSPVQSACSSPASNKNSNNSSSPSNTLSACKSVSSNESVTNSPAKFNEADLNNMQLAINMAMSMNPNLSHLAALNFELYQNALMKVWRPW